MTQTEWLVHRHQQTFYGEWRLVSALHEYTDIQEIKSELALSADYWLWRGAFTANVKEHYSLFVGTETPSDIAKVLPAGDYHQRLFQAATEETLQQQVITTLQQLDAAPTEIWEHRWLDQQWQSDLYLPKA